MAVVAPPPIHTKLDFWESAADSGTYPLESPEQMTSIMSYQYPPPPPPNGADMDMPHSGYMPTYSVPPANSTAPMNMRPSHHESSLKDRKESFSQANTPDHQLGLAGEKRRNKLGYHRTSVACGHCRRRKIRCIPSPADVQGRCINCIRLKKECSFFPVDQQPPTDPRVKVPSRASTGPKIASASSSPALPSGHPSDMPPHGQYPPLAMPSIQNMAPPSMKPAGTETYPPESKMPSSASASSRSFDFATQPLTNWMSAEQSSGSGSKPGDLNTTWRSYPHESPITPSFSPYTPHAPPPSATWSTPVSSEHNPREDIAWTPYPPPPPRSMSFGAESMSSQPPGQYPPMAQNRPYERKSSSMSSDMYPPPIATTIPSIESVPGTTMEHNVSLSAGAVPPPNYGSWQQPYSYPKPGESYHSWGYGENGSNVPMPTSETVPPSTESQPQSAGMYYSGR